jgi:hypothetical protein
MAATADLFRKLALSLPGAVESAHMGHPDFRVLCADGKLRIFATLSGEPTGRGVLKLTLDQQSAFREEMPEVFEPCAGAWGRMGMTYVTLEAVEEATLKGALATAHRNVTASSIKNAVAKRTAKKNAAAKKASAKPKMKS